jgi:hypothetical protein
MTAPLQSGVLSRPSPQQSYVPAPVNKPALRLRLILLVVGTMFPLALLSAAITWQNYQAAKSAASARVLQSTRTAIAATDRELQYLIAGLEVLASRRSGSRNVTAKIMPSCWPTPAASKS